MLVEELLDQKLEERLSKQAAERNYNFFRPVGQFIEHVDTVNFHMDSDGTFHFDNVGQVNGEPDASRMPPTETEDTDPTPSPSPDRGGESLRGWRKERLKWHFDTKMRQKRASSHYFRGQPACNWREMINFARQNL